jgi:hypothetical protein
MKFQLTASHQVNLLINKKRGREIMKKDYLYAAQINFGTFFGFSYIYGLSIYLYYSITEVVLVKILILITLPIITYSALAIWVNRFYFYTNEIKIIYLFRFSKRFKSIEYSQIKLIKYIHTAGKGKQPMIVMIYEDKKFSKLFKPSNSFTHRSFKKRKEILKFLDSKGIPIEIITDFNEDRNILI